MGVYSRRTKFTRCMIMRESLFSFDTVGVSASTFVYRLNSWMVVTMYFYIYIYLMKKKSYNEVEFEIFFGKLGRSL